MVILHCYVSSPEGIGFWRFRFFLMGGWHCFWYISWRMNSAGITWNSSFDRPRTIHLPVRSKAASSWSCFHLRQYDDPFTLIVIVTHYYYYITIILLLYYYCITIIIIVIVVKTLDGYHFRQPRPSHVPSQLWACKDDNYDCHSVHYYVRWND